jgi:hypothetical protein
VGRLNLGRPLTRLPFPWRPTMALLSVAVVAGACAQAGAVPTAPSASPAPSTVVASTEAGASSQPAGTSMAEPPPASLNVEGGDPVVGQLGSFTWQNGGSDAPWLDGSPIHVAAGERLALTFGAPVGVANWTARRVTPGNRDGIGAIRVGTGSGAPVVLDAPPPGSWSIDVDVRFNDFDEASYFWLVTVE